MKFRLFGVGVEVSRSLPLREVVLQKYGEPLSARPIVIEEGDCAYCSWTYRHVQMKPGAVVFVRQGEDGEIRRVRCVLAPSPGLLLLCELVTKEATDRELAVRAGKTSDDDDVEARSN